MTREFLQWWGKLQTAIPSYLITYLHQHVTVALQQQRSPAGRRFSESDCLSDADLPDLICAWHDMPESSMLGSFD